MVTKISYHFGSHYRLCLHLNFSHFIYSCYLGNYSEMQPELSLFVVLGSLEKTSNSFNGSRKFMFRFILELEFGERHSQTQIAEPRMNMQLPIAV